MKMETNLKNIKDIEFIMTKKFGWIEVVSMNDGFFGARRIDSPVKRVEEICGDITEDALKVGSWERKIWFALWRCSRNQEE